MSRHNMELERLGMFRLEKTKSKEEHATDARASYHVRVEPARAKTAYSATP